MGAYEPFGGITLATVGHLFQLRGCAISIRRGAEK